MTLTAATTAGATTRGPVLEKIWLQRRDVPAHIYNYAYAAFIAGFTGQPKPDLLSAEGAVFPR